MKNYRPYTGPGRRLKPIDAAVIITGIMAAASFVIALALSII